MFWKIKAVHGNLFLRGYCPSSLLISKVICRSALTNQRTAIAYSCLVLYHKFRNITEFQLNIIWIQAAWLRNKNSIWRPDHKSENLCAWINKLNCFGSWNKQLFIYIYISNTCITWFSSCIVLIQGDKWTMKLSFMFIIHWLVHYKLESGVIFYEDAFHWKQFMTFLTEDDWRIKIRKGFPKSWNNKYDFISMNLDDVKCEVQRARLRNQINVKCQRK